MKSSKLLIIIGGMFVAIFGCREKGLGSDPEAHAQFFCRCMAAALPDCTAIGATRLCDSELRKASGYYAGMQDTMDFGIGFNDRTRWGQVSRFMEVWHRQTLQCRLFWPAGKNDISADPNTN